MHTIFIDGREGTTGLRIQERLAGRADIDLILLPEDKRKDVQARKEALNDCDAAFLCLPDAAALEAAALVTNPRVILLDGSTAHRTEPGWVYGFPELGFPVAQSKRIAVPGCHASGFLALITPLVRSGILPKDALLPVTSLTGYSGGGKKMIAAYEAPDRSPLYAAPRPYALSQAHKHLKEMKAVAGLENAPAFLPVVGDFYSGMLVTVMLHAAQLAPGYGLEDVKACLRNAFPGPVVRCAEDSTEAGFLSAAALAGTDGMEISVYGNEERMTLCARFDNLGKGASGAAVQCMNLALGCPQMQGLTIQGGNIT